MHENHNYLVTAPVTAQGGIASFVNNITPYLSGDVNIFHRGKSDGKNGMVSKIMRTLSLPRKFRKAIREYKPDRILINSSLSKASMLRDGMLVRAAKRMGVKTVLFVHGFQHKDANSLKLLRWGYFKADAIVVLADEFRQILIDAGYKGPVYVSLNPIDKELFDLTDNNELTGKPGNIMFLSRMVPGKGIKECLQIFEIVQKKHPELVLNMLGDGECRAEAEKYVADHGMANVVFHGYVTGDAKRTQLLESLLLLCTSYSEGLPISVLEAMAAGQVVMSTAVGGIKDLAALHNFGFMCQGNSPQEFAEAFEKIYADKAKMDAIRLANKQFAHSHFHPSNIADGIMDCFDKI